MKKYQQSGWIFFQKIVKRTGSNNCKQGGKKLQNSNPVLLIDTTEYLGLLQVGELTLLIRHSGVEDLFQVSLKATLAP